MDELVFFVRFGGKKIEVARDICEEYVMCYGAMYNKSLSRFQYIKVLLGFFYKSIASTFLVLEHVLYLPYLQRRCRDRPARQSRRIHEYFTSTYWSSQF